MLIKEGSLVYIIDKNDESTPITNTIKVEENIELEGNGNGYTFLLRSEGIEENSIFVAEEIIKTCDNVYEVKGYFKDAILVINRYGREAQGSMYESYTQYD